MFQKIKEKKQQLVRFLFGSFTATALMFTFQACYGMPPQNDFDATIQGVVKSAEKGFMIVSATDLATPVLAFSLESNYEPVPAAEFMCNSYAQDLTFLKNNPASLLIIECSLSLTDTVSPVK